MTKFESNQVTLNTDCDNAFTFLSDFRNFEELLPGQVKNWYADESSCKFTIEGLADLAMRIDGKYPYRNIHIVSDGKNPVDFKLDYYFTPEDDSACRFSIVFDVDLNPFQKMLASNALQNFVNMLADKLRERYA
jgi:carbon monoxide dehydrogenase subunit G